MTTASARQTDTYYDAVLVDYRNKRYNKTCQVPELATPTPSNLQVDKPPLRARVARAAGFAPAQVGGGVRLRQGCLPKLGGACFSPHPKPSLAITFERHVNVCTFEGYSSHSNYVGILPTGRISGFGRHILTARDSHSIQYSTSCHQQPLPTQTCQVHKSWMVALITAISDPVLSLSTLRQHPLVDAVGPWANKGSRCADDRSQAAAVPSWTYCLPSPGEKRRPGRLMIKVPGEHD